jgi:outer membrane murein-binding lipoprotein Lpp
MTQSSLPAAGWYPAAHANGEQRYWDGAAWIEPTAPVSAPAQTQGFFTRPVTRRTGAIVAGSALVLGLLLGAGMGSTTAQTQVASLASEVSSLQTEVTEAAETVTDASADVQAAAAQVAEAKAEVEKVKGQLAASTSKVTEMETAATAAQAELDSRASQIADLQGKVSAQSAPAPAPAQPVAPSAVSYKNCSEARAAGAAPVRRGDPGYGKHLDRDGDGVGCE